MADPAPDASSVSALALAVRSGDPDRATRAFLALGGLHPVPTYAGDEAGPGIAGALTRDGDFVPFYFTDAEKARAYAVAEHFLPQGRAETVPEEVPPREVLRRCLQGGFAGIVLNPGTEEPVPLSRATVDELAARTGVPEEEQAGATGSGAGRRGSGSSLTDAESGAEKDAAPSVLRPPPHLLELADRVRRSPELPTVRPPRIEAEECGALLQELRELWADDRLPLWELLDTLAFEMAVHVPVAPDPVRGLRWPLVAPHPSDPTTSSVWLFTDPEKARAAMAGLPEEVDTLRLSGFEALRWIWAAPEPVEQVVVDLYPGSPGPLTLPDTWIPGLLYPHYAEVELERVRRVPLARIGGLPGARGTKPECVRSLVGQWHELVAVTPDGAGSGAHDGESPRRGAGPGEIEAVEYEGRRFLPFFSSPEAYFDFDAARRGRSGTPLPLKDRKDAPFREWLLESSGCDGMILDPGGPHPLPLDHTDLAVLALWIEKRDRPDGSDLVALAAELRDSVGPRIAGRIAADWPRYYWALQPGPGEEEPRTLTLPGRDVCPVFSHEAAVRSFLDSVRDRGLVAPSMRPFLYLTGWAFNVFQEMRTRYREGGRIDPRPEDPLGSGLEISGDALAAALARVEWRLQPRVPGFLAGD